MFVIETADTHIGIRNMNRRFKYRYFLIQFSDTFTDIVTEATDTLTDASESADTNS